MKVLADAISGWLVLFTPEGMIALAVALIVVIICILGIRSHVKKSKKAKQSKVNMEQEIMPGDKDR